MKAASAHPRSISDGSDGRSMSSNGYATYVLHGIAMQSRGNDSAEKKLFRDIYSS